MAELHVHRPYILAACQKAMSVPKVDVYFVRVDAEALKACEDELLDYAVMGQGDPLMDSKDALEAAKRASALGAKFRAQYQRAEAMARENR